MDNVFDPEFFPTPDEVIEKMLAPYAATISSATILEPSAGNGAILDYLSQKGVPYTYETGRGQRLSDRIKVDRTRLYAIERNEELRLILQGKKYKVIASDFLTFLPEHRFTLLAMNPPFATGADHLLHAWDILQGGDIACLLNAETVNNPFSASRKRLTAIIERHGSVEFIGQAFRTADNPTDVEIALVRLHKESEDDPFRIDFDPSPGGGTPDFGELASSRDDVAVSNGLDAYIRCWEKTKLSAVEFIRSFARFRFYAKAFLPQGERGENVMEHILTKLKDLRYENESMAEIYNDFLDTTKASAWGAIIEQMGLGKYMTTGLQKTLDEFRTAQGAMEITKENIGKLFKFVIDNIDLIRRNCVVEVYDLFTRFFKGNTSYDEGWKTNKRFKCNRKVILPDVADAGFKPQLYGYRQYFGTNYRHRLSDIDKAMCWLTGRDYDALDNHSYDITSRYRSYDPDKATIETVIQCIPVGDQGWHESAFFRIKAFKKGTIHLEFKDEDLWNRFNIAVNDGKNQLGMSE
jgi:hypothetical protein